MKNVNRIGNVKQKDITQVIPSRGTKIIDKGNIKEITILAAKTRVDNNGNIMKTIVPYNRFRIMEQILGNVGNVGIGDTSLLHHIINNSADWIGSHVKKLEDWVVDENLIPHFEWPLCTTQSCRFQGIGYCGSWCIGGHCHYQEVVPGNPDLGIPAEKDMHYEIGISLFFK